MVAVTTESKRFPRSTLDRARVPLGGRDTTESTIDTAGLSGENAALAASQVACGAGIRGARTLHLGASEAQEEAVLNG